MKEATTHMAHSTHGWDVAAGGPYLSLNFFSDMVCLYVKCSYRGVQRSLAGKHQHTAIKLTDAMIYIIYEMNVG